MLRTLKTRMPVFEQDPSHKSNKLNVLHNIHILFLMNDAVLLNVCTSKPHRYL
jgi:hypothetical protein